jgi:hypothetical protein
VFGLLDLFFGTRRLDVPALVPGLDDHAGLFRIDAGATHTVRSTRRPSMSYSTIVFFLVSRRTSRAASETAGSVFFSRSVFFKSRRESRRSEESPVDSVRGLTGFPRAMFEVESRASSPVLHREDDCVASPGEEDFLSLLEFKRNNREANTRLPVRASYSTLKGFTGVSPCPVSRLRRPSLGAPEGFLFGRVLGVLSTETNAPRLRYVPASRSSEGDRRRSRSPASSRPRPSLEERSLPRAALSGVASTSLSASAAERAGGARLSEGEETTSSAWKYRDVRRFGFAARLFGQAPSSAMGALPRPRLGDPTF